jgi:hypothetical protein
MDEGVSLTRLRRRVLAFEQLQQFGRQLQELVPGPVWGVGEGNAGVLRWHDFVWFAWSLLPVVSLPAWVVSENEGFGWLEMLQPCRQLTRKRIQWGPSVYPFRTSGLWCQAATQ